MGRYYNGDIEGKFWLGSQSSNDADFFGVSGEQPGYLEYFFDKNNLIDIKKGLEECKKALGIKDLQIKILLKEKKGGGYSNEELAEACNITIEESKIATEWYARKILGEKILKCIEEKGECNFTAEL